MHVDADGLLEIFFSCEEQRHMGHTVLFADVSFFNITKKTFFSEFLEIEPFTSQSSLHQPLQDYISFAMSSPYPVDLVILWMFRGFSLHETMGFSASGEECQNVVPNRTQSLLSFVIFNFSLPLQLENKLKE